MPFVDGLFSGLDTTSIINQLLAIEQRPILVLQGRVETTTKEKTALMEVSARLLALKTRAGRLAETDLFDGTKTSSSNESVLKASGDGVETTGSFVFRVGALASADQYLSNGFADPGTTPVGAGTLEITFGGGFVSPSRELSTLNGGAGVSAGKIRVTDKSGGSALVDIGPAATVQDVLSRINQVAGISVTASVSGDSFVLTDTSGGAGPLKVEEVGGTAAADLGLLGSTPGMILTGSDVSNLTGSSTLTLLNDGNGVRRVSGSDFRVTLRDGTVMDFDIATGTTRVSEVLDMITNHALNGGKLTARIAADGNRLELVDNTGVAGTMSVTALGGSNAAQDLGILGSVTGGAPAETLVGERVLAPVGSVLLRDLKGGTGIGLGTIAITDRSGALAAIDVSGAETLQDVIDAINADPAVNVEASVNPEGNGLLVRDLTGLTGSNLVVTDSVGTTAADLAIDTGPGGVAANEVSGGNALLQFVGEQTLLSDLGVVQGKFEIIDSNGVRSTIDLTQSDDVRIEDVIEEINGAFVSVTARVNDRGDGIVVEDTGGGALLLEIRDLAGGTTAKDLRIAGKASGTGPANVLEGSRTGTVAISATDTLQAVRDKVNALGLPVSASILNTGSGPTPYRLALTSKIAGFDGRLLVDPGDTAFAFNKSVTASDAVLLFGGGGDPARLTSNQNTFRDVVDGLTLDLVNASDDPVTVNVQADVDDIVAKVKSFVDKFNEAMGKIEELTAYDSESEKRALLFGDSTLRGTQNRLFRLLTDPASALSGRFRTLSQVGVKLLEDGTLTFDENAFRDAYALDPEALEDLFANDPSGFGKRFEDALEFLTDPTDGAITRATNARDLTIEDLKERIETMNERIESKRTALRRQFTSMEQAFLKSQSILQRLTQAFSSLNRSGGGGFSLFGG
ncbi:MAG: flagellar filament capping protein FliD [Planctomycetes bacterium]|nr:flagellar filament capping protein FliD [Planctomycetota bacterium]